MSYQPEQDPRFIPGPVEHIEVVPDAPDFLGDEIERLEKARMIWAMLDSLFEHPGWQTFMETIQGDLSAIDAKMARENDMTEWKFLRGQATHAQWILSLPVEIHAKHAQVVEAIQDLSTEREGADRG